MDKCLPPTIFLCRLSLPASLDLGRPRRQSQRGLTGLFIDPRTQSINILIVESVTGLRSGDDRVARCEERYVTAHVTAFSDNAIAEVVAVLGSEAELVAGLW